MAKTTYAKTLDLDAKTLNLIKEVTRQKAEISKAERPQYVTNCSFSFSEDQSKAINIHVESNIKSLICIAAYLNNLEKSYSDSAILLGVSEPPSFTWCGFKPSEWFEDIKLRITKIQISSKKKKLEALETRLNAIISTELKAELELEAITAELG